MAERRFEGSCSTTPGADYYVPHTLLSHNFNHDVRARLHAAPRATATAQRRLACLAGIFQNAVVTYGEDFAFPVPHMPCTVRTYTSEALRQEVAFSIKFKVASLQSHTTRPATVCPGVRPCVLEGGGAKDSTNPEMEAVGMCCEQRPSTRCTASWILSYLIPHVLCVFCAYHRVLSHKPLVLHPHLATSVLFCSDEYHCALLVTGNPAKPIV